MEFYDRILDSESVGDYFENADMKRLIDHQTKFIASLLGGPAAYTDNQLRQLHAHLDVKDAHFDQLEVVLRQTLIDHGVDPDDVEAVVGEFEKRRSLIVR